MELQLGLALPNPAADHDHASDGLHTIDLDLNMGIRGGYHGCGPEIQQYRQFHDVEGRVPEDRTRWTVPRTLPLLHWAGREGNRYDDEADEDEYMDTDSSSYRQLNRRRSTLSGHSNYVKVSMEGIGIGRKVDLSLHHSFHALKDTLLHMFGIYNADSDHYKLAYKDRRGHWVIEEESSWRDFIRSAQRLKMVKFSG